MSTRVRVALVISSPRLRTTSEASHRVDRYTITPLRLNLRPSGTVTSGRLGGSTSRPQREAADRWETTHFGPQASQAATRVCSRVRGAATSLYTPWRTGTQRPSTRRVAIADGETPAFSA